MAHAHAYTSTYASSGTQNARQHLPILTTRTPSLVNLDLGLLREGVRGDDPALAEVLTDLLHGDVRGKTFKPRPQDDDIKQNNSGENKERQNQNQAGSPARKKKG